MERTVQYCCKSLLGFTHLVAVQSDKDVWLLFTCLLILYGLLAVFQIVLTVIDTLISLVKRTTLISLLGVAAIQSYKLIIGNTTHSDGELKLAK